MDLKKRTEWVIGYISDNKNLTDVDISKMVGSKPDTIRKYRSGLAVPRLNFISRFCNVFNVDKTWFTTGTGDPFPDMDRSSCDTPPAEDTGEEEHAIGPTLLPGEVSVEAGKAETHEEKTLLQPASEGNAFPAKPALFGDSSGTGGIDCEKSFQKLAVLAGIRINSDWMIRIAKAAGITPLEISMAVYHNRIGENTLKKIEAAGYQRDTWTVPTQADDFASNAITEAPGIAELTEMAKEVLQSGTIHSSALAMNIISLKAALNKTPATTDAVYKPEPVQGANAVIW